MHGHRYTIEFRILGAAVDPAAITEELGLQPSRVWLPGSRRGDGEFRAGMWGYNGAEETDSHEIDWDTLEQGLEFVLDRLWPHKEVIALYQAGARAIWWCGHFQEVFDGGPRLSPSLLKRLGEFGVELSIDNYFSPTHASTHEV